MEQEERFLNFIRGDKVFCKYYDAVYILFNTGLQIAEFAGLTVSDIDFVNEKIRVDHQLLRRSKDHHIIYVIENTKTASGVRYVPMTKGVSECFRRIIENPKRRNINPEPAIDGIQGFLLLSKKDIPIDAGRWQKYFDNIYICIQSDDISIPLIIMEFKIAKNFQGLEEAAEHAMVQIESQKYSAGMSEKGYTECVYIGIGFFLKQCKVKCYKVKLE